MENILKPWMLVFLLLWLRVRAEVCDPDTEYLKDDQCCKMCGPGTRMNAQSSCKDPNCVPCSDGEYQPKYTNGNKCELQPYCDPNVNLEQDTLDRTRRVPCKCKAGHHCSNEDCLTCVRNTECKAGEGVLREATPFNDTVCQKCEDGTFSNETSAVARCTPWKRCDEASEIIKTPGSPTFDVECGKSVPRWPIVIPVVAVLLIFVMGSGYLYKKGVFAKMLKKFKGGKHDDIEKPCAKVDLLGPLEDLVDPEINVQQEKGAVWEAAHSAPTQPEENEDHSFQSSVQERDLTENHNPLRQEEGKSDHAPCPESNSTYGN
ncbi:hypothetical protein AGOR_G00079810 [Albula goreensis]|uniref:TNFR-Cys domain-containing protein n=1 Tax=Albula goreensis TaxID=1534307 RepID=A0A8T3DM57_9TELE|nr:hypothetical protein AGOR_G00079810 [Albula goreensis]